MAPQGLPKLVLHILGPSGAKVKMSERLQRKGSATARVLEAPWGGTTVLYWICGLMLTRICLASSSHMQQEGL